MKQDRKNALPLEKAFSKQIKIELVERGMSQVQLAEKINIDRVTLNRYLNNKVSFGHQELINIADAFGMSLSELIRRAEARLPGQDQTL